MYPLRWAALAAAWLYARPAIATTNLTLEWEAPPGCPDKNAVLVRAARLLGAGVPETPLLARGKIVKHGQRYALELSTELGETRGFRRIEAAKCEDLAQPAALLVALAIDPEALARSATTSVAVASLPPVEEVHEPTTPPAGERQPKTKPPAQTSSPAEANRAEDPRLERAEDERSSPEDQAASRYARAGVGGTLDVGTLPRAAFGGTLTLAVGLDRTELEARGALYTAQTEAVSGGAAGELGLATFALAGCYRALNLTVSAFSLCAGGEAARLTGKGKGVSDPGSGAVWLLSGVIGLRAAKPLSGPVSVWARLDAAVLLNQPRFVLENVGEVHQPSRFSGRGSLGAEVQFP
jgi:hypothetical protein